MSAYISEKELTAFFSELRKSLISEEEIHDSLLSALKSSRKILSFEGEISLTRAIIDSKD